MALTDENGSMVMPVAPMYGNGGNSGWGNDSSWWFILLILAMFGGWGNGFGGGIVGNDAAVLYPWMNQAGLINSGFDNAALTGSLSGIQSAVTSGFGDVQNSLCAGFAGVNAGIANGFAQAEISNNARQMANMQQIFGLQSQFADCCCENRLASADLKYTIATENCADRAALSDGIRDVIESQTRGTQTIIDKLCQLELDAKSDKIADLERQLTMANLAASQTAQNAFIAQGFSNEVDALYNRLNTCPVPTTPVYGRTPIFTCNGNNGCGCGCSGASF